MSLLNTLKQMAHSPDSLITPLVWSNTKYLSQIVEDNSDEFLFLVALATYELAKGNTCVNVRVITGPRHWPNHPMSQLNIRIDDALGYLEAKQSEWLEAFYVTPLRYHRGRLYLDRQFQLERKLAKWISTRISEGALASIDLMSVKTLSDRYFAFNQPDSVDWQKAAAVMGLTRKFTIITGGPGTGKTTTVTRMLSMVFEAPQLFGFAGEPKVVLAAPTGKAKNRMAESIQSQLCITEGPMALPVNDRIKEKLSVEVQTIHRLLQVNPTKEQPHFNAFNKLDCDLCVVDEGSMIDLEMACQLVDALPEKARLIVLADKDQLASVDAGAVISELFTPITPINDHQKSIGLSGATREIVESCLDCSIAPWLKNESIPLANHVISLQKSHRFNESTGIGVLAASINQADSVTAKSVFDEYRDVNWHLADDLARLRQIAVNHFEDYHRRIADSANPETAFNCLGEQVILTSVKKGPFGSTSINRDIVQYFGQSGMSWYLGMPVMITENAYKTGLFNGDIGVVLPDEQGNLKACFQAPDGSYRFLSRHRLPAWEVSYALTIHKSQGSEWSSVIVILSDNANLETKELLYTGLTRAKSTFQLISSEIALSKAIRRRSLRSSGLFEEVEAACRSVK
ncbi:exodeoxyribonuclease V subunit alpha [Reinekea sp. G2M2-21]|uniref:exodeoxyribonuclease V subunit alpha n=1 Tax=Reinekea sp. G2M2-21 TaxID=2788942 RepID=UPI0018AA4476|nr:exodeoxyribonuclease V subunit alpha [Reinekea sp. G2M2-21]